MICPHCGHDNLPGSEECHRCSQDLTQLDRPVPADRVERSLIEDRVRILQPRRPVAVRSTATVRDAVTKMLDANVGALLVMDEKEAVVGIFSERDVLMKVAGLHDDLTTQVGVVMTPGASTEVVEPNHTLAFALHKMDVGGYRHIPVVENGRPVGMISVRDMLRHITRLSKD